MIFVITATLLDNKHVRLTEIRNLPIKPQHITPALPQHMYTHIQTHAPTQNLKTNTLNLIQLNNKNQS